MENHQTPAEITTQDHLFISFVSFYIHVNVDKLLLK